MAGYQRQSVADIINGLEVTAPPLNAEFNRLELAFNGVEGHTHSGAAGDGGPIPLGNLSGYVSPAQGGTGGQNNLSAVAAPTVTDDASIGYAPGSLWLNTVSGRMYQNVGNTVGAAVWRELLQITETNQISPSSTGVVDLGTDLARFRSAYFSNAIAAATGTFTGPVSAPSFVGALAGGVTGNVSGNVTGDVTGNVNGNLTGNVTSTGNSTFGNVTINGTIDVTATQIKNVAVPLVGTDAATKGYVDTALDAIISAAPGTLDTLNELAAALGDDPNYSATVTASLAEKLPKAGGAMTGNIAMGGFKVTGLAAPTSGSDAVTLTYLNSLYGSTASAAESASAAAAAYDSFDDRYLGAKATDPTVDNDGNALLVGALYFNTTSNKMRVRSSGAWNDASINQANVAITGGTIDGMGVTTLLNIARGDARYPVKDTSGDISTQFGFTFARGGTGTGDANLYLDSAGGFYRFFRGGSASANEVARIDGTGTALSAPVSLITREKGDARYGIIERGTNANGHYVRYSDGTQICWAAALRLPYLNAVSLRKTWTFPAAFNAVPAVIPSLDLASAVGYADTASTRPHWGATSALSVSSTNGLIDQYRAVSAPDIPNTAYADAYVVAVGYWK